MRSLEITSKIQERLRAHLGDDLPDLESIKVFEGIAVSTRPVNKRGTLWDKARVSRATLREMAEWLNAGNQVPLQTLHNTSGELPVGRLFYGEVRESGDDEAELRVQFYIDTNTQSDLVNSIDTGVLQSMSIGLMFKQLLCSECGWDYLGDEAEFSNLFNRVCGNGHQLGEDGIHIRASGMDHWAELSLVSLGASKDAVIISRSKAQLSEEKITALAASGAPAESAILVATEEGQEDMSHKELYDRLEAQAGQVATLTAERDQATEQIETLTAERDGASSRVAELEKQLEADGDDAAKELRAELDSAKADLEKAQESADATLEFLQDQAVKALVAAGQEDPEAPETIEACIASIKDSKTNLMNLLDKGGDAHSSDAGNDGDKPEPRLSATAFKTPKL